MGRVMMGFDTGALHERVTSVEEFADVASVVLLQSKLATGVHFLETGCVEDEIVEEKERHSSSYTLIKLVKRVNHEASLRGPLLINRSLHDHVRLPVLSPVEQLTDEHQEAEGKQADQA